MKREWRPEYVLALVSVALVVFYNASFWKRVFGIVHPQDPGAWLFLCSAVFLLVAFFNLVLACLPLRWVTRPLLSLLLPMAALTTYFMNQYGVVMDDRMVQNIFETDFRESLALFSIELLVYFLLLGVLPVLLLWRLRLRKAGTWEMLRNRLSSLLASLLVIGLIALVFYQSYASLLRNNRDLRHYLVPNNFIKGMMDYFHDSSEVDPVLAVIAPDAKRMASTGPKTLFVLVIGETARGMNFSLNGYARNTNPRLATQEDLVNFPDARSCGTDTAVSLPCMLSGLGREGYSLKKARSQENLLDVVKRAGMDVLWIDNQSGCKRTCDRVLRINTTAMKDPVLCPNGECHDEIMLTELRKYAQNLPKDTLVVLHQMGSHGPAYHLRYPEKFRQFTPECRTNLLDKCSQQEILNSYDNTILYTDHFLSALMDTLRAYGGRYSTGMMYLSDHGESLGEYGLYLHGAPYMLAPAFQTHVPFMIWLSPGLQQQTGIQASCLQQRAAQPVSQDHVFHSMLGVLGIQTTMHRPDLDVFAACRR